MAPAPKRMKQPISAVVPRRSVIFWRHLAVLRKHVRDDSVDLVYLDPPFNSNATYNVLYKSPVGSDVQVRV